MRVALRRLWATFCVAGLLIAAGCRTYADRVESARLLYYRGELVQAAKSLEEADGGWDGSGDLIKLERASVLLAEGRSAESERLMREVRDRFDELESGGNVAQRGAVWLTDDTHSVYAGEDYERVLIRAMLALANLMHDGGDAEAYSLQISEKQKEIIERAVDEEGNNPKATYQQVAFGPYLRGVLREATHVHYDDAARAFDTVVKWQPSFLPGPQDLQRALHGRHSEKGNGVLYVFGLVGRGPHKEEVAEIPSSQAMLVADRIISVLGKQTLPPTLAPIKVPKVVSSGSVLDGVGVDVDGRPIGRTQTITDVTQMAVSQAAAVHDHIVGQAIARRALKKGMVYGAKELAGVDKHSMLALGMDVAGVVYEATEKADTRCWSLLPDKIQVLRLELPAGEHAIALRAIDRTGRPCGAPTMQKVSIVDGRNRYLLVHFPSDRLVGKVSISAE